MSGWNLYGMDTSKFLKVKQAFDDAKGGNAASLRDIGKGIDVPGVTLEDVVAAPAGDKAGRAFAQVVHRTCRGDESLPGCDLEEVHRSLAALLKSPANGCDPASVDQFMPPRFDGTQRGKGKLGAISMLAQIVHRGSPIPGGPIKYYIPQPEVPELFGELSPTEVKYDASPEGKLVRRFYDFVESMMIIGEGGYQIAAGEDGGA